MRPRDIARFVRDQVDREARRTRAHEKARVVSRDTDGNTVVEYRGASITLAGPVPLNISEGQWLLVERTNAGLQAGGRSAYGAG